MSPRNTANAPSSAGAFATSRRGGLTGEQIREIKAARAKPRPTPWQALARQYGVSELDIRGIFDPPKAPAVVVAPTPPGWCRKRRIVAELWAENIPIRVIADRLGVSESYVKQLAAEMDLPKRGPVNQHLIRHWTPEMDAARRQHYVTEKRSVTTAARLLAVGKNTLRRRVRELGLDLERVAQPERQAA